MLASISPLGERARHNSYPVTVASYLLGSAAGGAVVGALLGLLGLLVGTALPAPPGIGAGRGALTVLALAAVAAFVADAAGLRLPGPSRQVDESWLHAYRGWVYGGGYGFQLGLGAVTVVSTAALPLLWLVELLLAAPGWAAALGAGFGLVRAAPLLAAARVRTPTALRRVHARLAAAAPVAAAATTTACFGVAVAATVALVR